MGGQSVIPTCYDSGGTASSFKVASLREKLRSQGKTQDEILAAIGQGFVSGELRTPRAGGITYMLSSVGYRHNPEGDGLQGRGIGSEVIPRPAPVALVTDDPMDDRVLVQRSSQGDEGAFRSLVERHQGGQLDAHGRTPPDDGRDGGPHHAQLGERADPEDEQRVQNQVDCVRDP